MLWVWRELGSEADAEFLAPILFYPLPQSASWPGLQRRSSLVHAKTVEEYLRLLPATDIYVETPSESAEQGHFQRAVESSVSIWWDVQGWISSLVEVSAPRASYGLPSPWE